MENYQVVVGNAGWHHINAPGLKRIGTVSRHPEKTLLWCEVKTVDHKAVYGDDLFPTREVAIKTLFGIDLQPEEEDGTSVPISGDRDLPAAAKPKKVAGTTTLGDNNMDKTATASTRGKNPGVVATIEKTLRRAGINEKPVSKEDILKALQKAFPDRPAASMENTIRFAPGHLLKKGHKVKKVKGRPLRYFIQPPKEQATA